MSTASMRVRPPAITSGNAAIFAQGANGSFSITTNGYPEANVLLTGTLPAGLMFVDNGDGTAVIQGIPDAGTAGDYDLLITADNGVNPNNSQNFSLHVAQGPVSPDITSPNNATFSVGSGSTFTVTSTGNPTAAIGESGSLPSGITFIDNGDGTATISGTPSVGSGGNYNITLTAFNGINPNSNQNFTLSVQEGPSITSTNVITFGLNQSGTFTITTTGNPIPGVSVVGLLPNGITFADNGDGTGTLSGTATQTGTFSVTIIASNGIGSNASQSATISSQKGTR